MRVVLITGASSGFGLEASLAFARKGDRVFPTDPKLLLYYANRTLSYGL